MPGKKEATGEDEKVEDKVERAEDVVDNVGSSCHILLAANCVCSPENINALWVRLNVKWEIGKCLHCLSF